MTLWGGTLDKKYSKIPVEVQSIESEVLQDLGSARLWESMQEL